MQILFAPREQKDANAYSEMLGTRTERSRTTSRSNGMFGARSGASESFSDQRRALMLPQEIKELDRDKEIILLENTRPILADRICYWRDRAFTSRLMAAPTVPALDLVRFSAQIEQRLRELSDDDVDDQTGELAHVRPDYLELVHAWDQRELPQALDAISSEEAAAYVDRHFTLLGVSADDARAGRRLARDEDGMTDAEAARNATGVRCAGKWWCSMSVAYINEADRVRAALATIPADDYTTWVDMAFAVKHGLGEAGFDLWDAWSQTAPNYDARSARATWRSASESGDHACIAFGWPASMGSIWPARAPLAMSQLGPRRRVPSLWAPRSSVSDGRAAPPSPVTR